MQIKWFVLFYLFLGVLHTIAQKPPALNRFKKAHNDSVCNIASNELNILHNKCVGFISDKTMPYNQFTQCSWLKPNTHYNIVLGDVIPAMTNAIDTDYAFTVFMDTALFIQTKKKTIAHIAVQGDDLLHQRHSYFTTTFSGNVTPVVIDGYSVKKDKIWFIGTINNKVVYINSNAVLLYVQSMQIHKTGADYILNKIIK